MTAARVELQTTDDDVGALFINIKQKKNNLEDLIYQKFAIVMNRISTDINILNSEKKALEQKAFNENQTQLYFIDRCNSIIDDFEMRLKHHKSKPNFFQSPITKDFLIQDMKLMLETIRLTHNVIDKPEEAASWNKSLTEHSSKIKKHLESEYMLTKTRKIWSGILFALSGIILLATSVLFPMILAGASLGVAVLSGMAVGFTSFGVGWSLFSHAPAKAQSDLCHHAQRLNVMRSQ